MTDHWNTPPEVFGQVASGLGWATVDLDPASNARALIPCRLALTGRGRSTSWALRALKGLPEESGLPLVPGGRRAALSGLEAPWPGSWRIWLNPPYSDPAPWVERLIVHMCSGGEGLALLPLGLETRWGMSLLGARGRGLRLAVWRGRISFVDGRRCSSGRSSAARGGSLVVLWSGAARFAPFASERMVVL